MAIKTSEAIVARPLSGDDIAIMQQVSAFTIDQAANNTMVARSLGDLKPVYSQGDAFGIIRLQGEESEIVAHAMVHGGEPIFQSFGPFHLLRRRIHEVSSVFATQKGNGFARDAVIGAVREKRRLGRRIKERRFLPERYIAFVRIDNVVSNKSFGKIPGSRRMTESEMARLPQVLLDEPVGTGENSTRFNGYDVTYAGRGVRRQF